MAQRDAELTARPASKISGGIHEAFPEIEQRVQHV